MEKKLLLPIILLVILLASCSKSRIYEKHTDMENSIWKRIDGNHVVKFTVNVKDTLSDFDISIAVRYMTGFPYTTLHVGFTLDTPEGEEKYSVNDLQMRGADGSYKGEGLGDIWDLTVPLIKNYRFVRAGVYKFEIENLMSKFETPGIMQIGLIIDKSKIAKANKDNQ